MSNGSNKKKQESSFRIFIRSKFFIPVLLILTFFIFVVGADLVYLILIVIHGYTDDYIGFILTISYAISNLIDAWIYIFLQRDVRRLFMKKVYWKAFHPSRHGTGTARMTTVHNNWILKKLKIYGIAILQFLQSLTAGLWPNDWSENLNENPTFFIQGTWIYFTESIITYMYACAIFSFRILRKAMWVFSDQDFL